MRLGHLFRTGLALAVLLLVCPASGQTPEAKNVLVLNSYRAGYVWTDELIRGIHSVFAGQPFETEIWVEFMDAARLSGPQYWPELRRFYRQKYGGKKFDGIIATDDEALAFLLQYHDELFPGVPAVFCGINDRDLAARAPRSVYSGVMEVFDSRPLLDLALRLHAQARRVYVVTDNSYTSVIQRDAYREIAASKPALDFQFLDGRTLALDEILRTLQAAPPESVVVTTRFVRDNAGAYFAPAEAHARLASAPNAPVYSPSISELGQGIVCGSWNGGFGHGATAARQAVRILRGESPAAISIEVDSANLFTCDYSQLARWGISESQLPRTVVYVNRPTSFFETYKYWIWGAAGFSASQALAILILAASIRRRRRAEVALRRRAEAEKLVSDIVLHFQSPTGSVETAIEQALDRLSAFTGAVRAKFTAGSADPSPASAILPVAVGDRLLASLVVEWNSPAAVWSAADLAPFEVLGGVFLQVRARLAAEEGRARLAAILEQTPDFVGMADPSGRVSYVNRAVRQIRPPGAGDLQMVGDIHPEWAAHVVREQGIPTAMRTGIWQGETAFLGPDGGEIPVSQIIIAHRNARGQVEWLSTIARDISARKRTEQLLLGVAQRVSSTTGEALFPSIVEYLALQLGASGAFIGELLPGSPRRVRVIALHWQGSVAPNFDYDLAGTPCERVAGSQFCFYPSHAREQFPRDELLQNMGVEGYAGIPLWNSSGQPLGLVSVLYQQPVLDPQLVEPLLKLFAGRVAGEIERLRAEQRVADSERFLRNLIENSSDAFCILTPDGVIRYQSPSAARVLGYPHEELAGKNLFDWIHPEDRRGGPVSLAYLSPQAPWVFRFHNRSGAWRQMEITGNNLCDDPAVGGIVCTLRDVTERNQIEERSRQSHKMEAIGRLAGGVAHDFNNLLTIVSGYGELLAGALGPGHELSGHTTQILAAARRAANLTNQLLTFSRGQVVEPRVVDLDALVMNLCGLLQPLIGEDVEIVTRLASAPGVVQADPGQIEQIIMNLAINARDAMLSGGRLTIVTSRTWLDRDFTAAHTGFSPGPFIVLALSDNGRGMDETVRAHVFEPFFTTKETGKGTGLGLSTVYGIVKQSGGAIDVSSELGHGSTFRIYLPELTGADAPASDGVPSTPRSGAETILVVEDETGVRRLVVALLRSLGYQVLEAETAGAARAIFAQNVRSIALLLTDVVMPVASGPQLAQEFVTACPGLKVLFMSGYTGEAMEEHGGLRGGAALIKKPFTKQLLAEKVRRALDGS